MNKNAPQMTKKRDSSDFFLLYRKTGFFSETQKKL